MPGHASLILKKDPMMPAAVSDNVLEADVTSTSSTRAVHSSLGPDTNHQTGTLEQTCQR